MLKILDLGLNYSLFLANKHIRAFPPENLYFSAQSNDTAEQLLGLTACSLE